MALSLAASLFPLASQAAAKPIPSDFYGVNTPGLFALPSSQWDAHLRAMSASRTGLVRADAAWWAAEPEAPSGGVHRYRWESFDQQVSAMAARGLRWYPVMAFSTPWAGVDGHDKSAPRSDADYTAYVHAFAARYGRGGQFWREHPALPQLPVTTYEIWNEQNSPHFWNPQVGGAERYADLFMAARGALRRVDPGARIVVGGLSNVPTVTRDTSFLARMYRHRPDLRGNVDAVAYHPYSVAVRGVYSEIARMRRALVALGQAHVPLEITEVGWTTTRTSEADRAGFLERLVRELPRSDCNVTRLIPYSWNTRERNSSDDEDWFGMYNLDATPKPSGAAYTRSVQQMTSAPPLGKVRICGGTAGRAGKSARPRLGLRVRVRGSLAGGVRVRTRCSRPCRVRVELVTRRRGQARRVATRHFRGLTRSRRVRIRGGRRVLRAARGPARVKVRAVATTGRAATARRVRRR